jgi:hypothetical protein
MLKKVLFPALLTSGAVLCSFSFLIAALGSKPVDIRMENEQLFASDFRNLFSPQMAAFLSAGAGITTAAMIGWSYSARKSSEVEEELSSMEETISVKESQIEALKNTPCKPVAASVNTLIKDKLQAMQTNTASAVRYALPRNTTQPVVLPTTSQVAQPLVVVDGTLAPEVQPRLQTSSTAISLFASAQAVLGLTHVSDSQNAEEVTASNIYEGLDITTPVQKLQSHIQQMREQVKLLEKAVQRNTSNHL